MLVENKSHRTSVYSRSFANVPDTNSFCYQSGRRRAYAQRLYFEYMYTQKVRGTTYFYTLTYNDKSLPYYFSDTPCFSYKDIRIVTNGALSKELERNYGSRLRYFVACETGEGKGSRGVGKNPHYHCIFFVQPLHDSDGNPIYDGYKVIHPLEFRRIIRRVWQGTENDYVNFNDCRFGICKEGENTGLVTGIAPFKYCSKYVLKDNNELAIENRVLETWRDICKKEGITLQVLWYYYLFNNEMVDGMQCHDMFYWLGLHNYNRWRKFTNDPDKSYIRFITRYAEDEYKVNITYVNEFFTTNYLKIYPFVKLREYRNECSGKVRCSKSLGEYGLNYIKNVECNPMFNIPSPEGFEVQSISQYYYRKLYYDKIRCDVSGNILYRLNTLGKRLKINSLSNTIEKHTISVNETLSVVFNNHFVEFDKFKSNRLFNEFVDSPVRDNIVRTYSIYKVVYEFRYFEPNDFIALDSVLSFDSVKLDYQRFIENDSYFFDYSYQSVLRKVYLCDTLCSTSTLPEFKKYIRLFRLLDSIIDEVRHFRSENAKQIFKANSELQKHIKSHRQ